MGLYDELAEWWPLISPVEDYREEAAEYARLLRSSASDAPVETVLELGCGGGNNAVFLKESFALTLVDRSAAMLDVSRGANPECAHVRGDMRDVRLGREFDAVFVHDAIQYMTTERDLAAALETAALHCRRGGAVLLCPDVFAETFAPGEDTGGVDRGGRGARFLEWTRDVRPGDSSYEVDYAFLLREADGTVRHVHDRHTLGLFPRARWLELCRAAGLEPDVRPLAGHPGVERILCRKIAKPA